MIIYDDDGIGYDVVYKVDIENAISEIESHITKGIFGAYADHYSQGLGDAVEIIRKYVEGGEKE